MNIGRGFSRGLFLFPGWTIRAPCVKIGGRKKAKLLFTLSSGAAAKAPLPKGGCQPNRLTGGYLCRKAAYRPAGEVSLRPCGPPPFRQGRLGRSRASASKQQFICAKTSPGCGASGSFSIVTIPFRRRLRRSAPSRRPAAGNPRQRAPCRLHRRRYSCHREWRRRYFPCCRHR